MAVTATRRRMRIRLRHVVMALLAGGLAMQLVPYGHTHHNPPVRSEPAWPTAQVRSLAVRACFDCHSNESRWPWYTYVAPASWYATSHVASGRNALNFSDWARRHGERGELAEAVRNGSMPPRSYTVLHPKARLSPSERDTLVAWLRTLR